VRKESRDTRAYLAQWPFLTLKDGVLCRRFDDNHGLTQLLQLIPPPLHREELLRQIHTGMTGNHMGVKKTLAQLQRRAYWVGWRPQALRFCQKCPECATYFRGRPPHSGPMQEMVIGTPLDRVGIDLTGPHPRSRRGFTYNLTYIDHFSKWAEATPLRNKEATTVVNALVTKIIPITGLPRQILSDNGREFRNLILDELSKRLGIDRCFTSPYTASTNGTTERLHRTLNSMLAKVVSTSQKDWCEHLPSVMTAYRSSVHSSTGFSPNFLMFGRELNAPIDLVLGRPDELQYLGMNDFAERKLSLLESAYSMARETLNASSARSKNYYDVHTRPKSLRVGEWVWFYSPRRYAGRSPKFQRNYSGPFLVVRQLGPVLYVVQKSPRSKEIVVHADKLKPCHADHPPSQLPKDGVATAGETSAAEEHVVVLPVTKKGTTGQHPSKLRVEATPFVPSALPVTDNLSETRPKRVVNPPLRYRQ